MKFSELSLWCMKFYIDNFVTAISILDVLNKIFCGVITYVIVVASYDLFVSF